MAYFWHPPLSITVVLDMNDTLVSLQWSGDHHPIRTVAEAWSEDSGWWVRRQWRDYYRLLTRTGLLVEIFQDRNTEQWYLQRLYD